MIVCDRHHERTAASRLVVSPTEQYDLCNPCMEEFRAWIASKVSLPEEIRKRWAEIQFQSGESSNGKEAEGKAQAEVLKPGRKKK